MEGFRIKCNPVWDLNLCSWLIGYINEDASWLFLRLALLSFVELGLCLTHSGISNCATNEIDELVFCSFFAQMKDNTGSLKRH